VILPVVLFIGVTTFVRMGTSNDYDAMCVIGMNRIRRAYMEIVPEVEPYLVMGTYDDPKNVNLSMGMRPTRTNFVVDVIVSTPFVVCTINSVIAGVIGALIAQQLNVGTLAAVAMAAVGVLIVFGMQVLIASRGIAAYIAAYQPKFPSPEAAATTESAG
jgi:energy-converting hydrogenase Eha subunit A